LGYLHKKFETFAEGQSRAHVDYHQGLSGCDYHMSYQYLKTRALEG